MTQVSFFSEKIVNLNTINIDQTAFLNKSQSQKTLQLEINTKPQNVELEEQIMEWFRKKEIYEADPKQLMQNFAHKHKQNIWSEEKCQQKIIQKILIGTHLNSNSSLLQRRQKNFKK